MFQSRFSVLFICLKLYVVLSLVVAQQSCVVSVKSTHLQLRCVAHVTDNTAEAVLAKGSSLETERCEQGIGIGAL